MLQYGNLCHRGHEHATQLLIFLIHHRLHAVARQQGQPDTGMTGGIDQSLLCVYRGDH